MYLFIIYFPLKTCKYIYSVLIAWDNARDSDGTVETYCPIVQCDEYCIISILNGNFRTTMSPKQGHPFYFWGIFGLLTGANPATRITPHARLGGQVVTACDENTTLPKLNYVYQLKIIQRMLIISLFPVDLTSLCCVKISHNISSTRFFKIMPELYAVGAQIS